MRLHLLCASVCTLSLFSTASAAAIILNDNPNYWTAPGGNFTSTSAGGAQFNEKVVTYSGFDDSYYDSLYYAFSDAGPIGYWDTWDPAGPSLYVSSSSEVKNPLTYDLSLSNLGSGLVTWSGDVSVNPISGPANVIGTRFTMEITDTFDMALALTDAASLGLSSSLGGVLDVAGDFKVTLNALMQNEGLAFTYNDGSGIVTCQTNDWCHAAKVFDNLQKAGGQTLYTSYDNAFYYSPVPVPAAVWLFGSGLIGLVGLARRKKS